MSREHFTFTTKQGHSVWLERYKGGLWQAGVLVKDSNKHTGGFVRPSARGAMRAALKMVPYAF